MCWAANTQSFHAPFSSKECAACHDKQSMGRYTASEPEMCYQCHDNFTNTYTILHAPVEAGSCTECHNPHQSQYPKLLKSDERAMCFSCHDYTEPNWISVHEGIDNAKCSECHNPHGSHESGLLKWLRQNEKDLRHRYFTFILRIEFFSVWILSEKVLSADITEWPCKIRRGVPVWSRNHQRSLWLRKSPPG